MTPVRRIAVGVAAALAVMLVPAHAGSAAAGDPDFHKPTVGDCHDYTLVEMYADTDTTPAVACTESHTGKVIRVAMLPDRIAWSQRGRVYDFMDTKCVPARDEWLGRSVLKQSLTAYGMSYFIPTGAERNRGARWVRCDVFLWRGSELSPLPYDEAPLIPRPLDDTVRRCLEPRTGYVTTCDDRYAWKAAGDFFIHQQRYPAKRAMVRLGQRRCPALVSTDRYRFTWPSKAAWAWGSRIGICFSKTRS